MKYGKIAFTAGVMFTVGRYVGEEIVAVIDKAAKIGLQKYAENGNERAQQICKNIGINVAGQSDYEKDVIGFKAN